MTPTPYRIDSLQGRLPFLLTLWLAIGVALLSALAPLGPPSSRQTGSAFNPATTSVVLKARAQTDSLVVRATRPDGAGKAAPLPLAAKWLLPWMAMLLGLWLFQSRDRFSLADGPPVPLGRLSRRHARAPPVFS